MPRPLYGGVSDGQIVQVCLVMLSEPETFLSILNHVLNIHEDIH